MPSPKNAGPASLTLVPAESHPPWPALRDLAFTLATEAAGLAGRLAPATQASVGDLVRGMNCYYSNLIEGHDTRPVDIERALRADFVAEPERRDPQIEAAAHIAVQAAIDTGDLDTDAGPSALAADIHRRFYERLPDSFRWVEEATSGRRVAVLPGRWREDNVQVGRHIVPAPDELAGWMARFDEAVPERFGRAERLVAIAAAHHRLVWIHPFADGNGRVARLVSHALLRRAGVGSPLWSVAARPSHRSKNPARPAALRIAFPLGETERLFPHLWAPPAVAAGGAPAADILDALRSPGAAATAW